jgi:hypothetical protein
MRPDDIFQMWEQMRHETELARLGFIRTDLQLCFTFADIAETQYNLGYQENTERTLTIAEKVLFRYVAILFSGKEYKCGCREGTATDLRAAS